MDELFQIYLDVFDHHYNAADLKPSGSRARAAAYKHQYQQDMTRKLRPCIKVCGRIAGRGYYRSDLKDALARGIRYGGIDRADIIADYAARDKHYSDIRPQFLALECRASAANENKVIQIEIDSENQHKYRGDPLLIRGI